MTYRNSQTDDQSTKLSQRARTTAAASWLAVRTWLTALYGSAAALPQRLSSMASGLFLEPPSNPRLVYRHGLRAEGLEQRQMLAGNIALDGTTTPAAIEDASVIIDVSEYNTGTVEISGVGVSSATHGVVEIVSDTQLLYTPSQDYNGPASFLYTLRNDTSGAGTVTLNLAAQNDAPTFGLATVPSVNEDAGAQTVSPILLNLSAGPADESGQSFSVSVSLANPADAAKFAAGPAIDLETNKLTYTPAANAFGNVVVNVTVTDSGGTAYGGDDSTTKPLTITINGQNDAPIAVGDSYDVDEDQTLTGNVLGNDSDVDGDTLTARLVDDVQYGTLTLNADGSFEYTPAGNYHGPDRFTYKAYDGTVYSDKVTVAITVNPVNDAPTVTTSSFSFGHIMEDNTLTFTAAAVLAATGASDVDGDTLSVILTGITGGGAYTLTGNGVDTPWVFKPQLNWSGNVTFSFSISDGKAPSLPVTASLEVWAVNDAPVHTLPGPQTTPEDTALVITGLAVSDVDVAEGTGEGILEVTLWVGHGKLTLAQVTGLTFSVGDGSDDTSMTFQGLVSAINSAIGSLTYNPTTDWNGTDKLTIVTSDLGDYGDPRTNPPVLTTLSEVNIVVTPEQDPPVAVADTYVVDEGETLTVPARGVLANDTDADGDALQAVLVSGTSNGTLLSLNADGSFTYKPDAGFIGVDSFTYKASDGTDESAPVSVVITVEEVNDPPVAVNDAYSVNEDTALTVALPGVLSNDTDDESDPLSAAIVAQPTNGSVTLNSNGSFTYTPNANFNGTDSFTYRANDGVSDSNVASVIITVNPVNDPPTNIGGTPASPTVWEDKSMPIDLSALDLADIDSTNLLVVLGVSKGTLSATSSGGVTVNNSTPQTMTLSGSKTALNSFLNNTAAISYLSAANDNGTDTLTITLNDTAGGVTVLANITINILSVNDAPTFNIGSDQVKNEDAGPQTVSGFLSSPSAGPANESGQTLSLSVSHVVTEGDSPLFSASPAIDLATGKLTYTPAPNASGKAVVTVTLSDNGGTLRGGVNSTAKTFTITINAVNDAPVAAGDTYTVDEDGVLTVSKPGVLGNDSDVEGDDLKAVLVNGPANGDLTLNEDGSFTYTPDPQFSGTDSFTYKANDGTADSNVATVTIMVNGTNNDPELVEPLPEWILVDEDIPTPISLSPAQIGDVDAGTGQLTLLLLTGGGTLSISGAGLTVTNNNTSTVSVTGNLTALNTMLASGITYTGEPNLNGTAVDAITLLVTDNGNTGEGGGGLITLGTVDININAMPDAPVAQNDAFSVNEDPAAPLTGNVLTNDSDVDGDTLTAALVGGAAHGAVLLNSDGSFTYTPALNFHGTDSFTYKANDGGLDSNVATVTITVNPVNDAPVAVNDTYTVDEDVVLTVIKPGVLGNDSDVDGDAVTAVVASGPSNGALTLNVDGSFTYTPKSNFFGTDSFTYRASDSKTLSNIATVTITVNPVQDPASVVGSLPGSITVLEEVETPVNTSGITISDVDAGLAPRQLTLSATGAGAISVYGADGSLISSGSTVVFESTVANINTLLHRVGAIRYTGGVNVVGQDVDSIQVSYTGLGLLGTISVDILEVNDAPVVTMPAGPFVTVEDATAPLGILAIKGIKVSDIDAGSQTIKLTLSVLHGTLQALGDPVAAGVTVGGSGNKITLAGSQGALTTYLASAGIGYLPEGNFNTVEGDAEVLTVVADDQGASGYGVPGTDSKTLAITVREVNDPPTVASQVIKATQEDVPVTFSVIDSSVSPGPADEPDAQSMRLVSSTLPANGTLGYSTDGTVTYTPNAEWHGTDSFVVTLRDDGTTLGAPAPWSVTRTVTITVAAVNDAPENVSSLTPVLDQTVTEDVATPLNLSWIDIQDVDAGNKDILVTLTVMSPPPADPENPTPVNPLGSLSAVSTVNVTVGGSGTATLTLLGSQSALSTFLQSGAVSYTGPQDLFGDDFNLVNIKVNDLGHSVGDPNEVDFGTITIDITEADDPMINEGQQPADHQAVEEQTSSIDLSSVVLADEDLAESDPIILRLDAGTGSLAIATETIGDPGEEVDVVVGHPGVTVSSDGGAIVLQGTLADVNAMLLATGTEDLLSYTGALDVAGQNVDAINLRDGSVVEGTDYALIVAVGVDIAPVNDAPELIGLPATATVNEDGSKVFTGIEINDVDVDPDVELLQLSLVATNGSVALATTAGLTVVSPGVYRGTLNALNAALATVTYTPTPQYNGAASLSVTVDDLGNIGSGGTLTDGGTIIISVTPKNDAPVLTVGGTVSTAKNTAVGITGIAVNDPLDFPTSQNGSYNAEVRLFVSHGTLLVPTAGITITGGANNSASLTIRGTFAAVNTALTGLMYTPVTEYVGTDTLNILANDLGNIGQPISPMFASATVNIAVAMSNTPPSFSGSLPAEPLAGTEDTDLVVSFGNLQVVDPDATAANMRLTLTVSAGSLDFTGVVPEGSTVVSDGVGGLIVEAPLTWLNSLLAGSEVEYSPVENANNINAANPTITVEVNDLANGGDPAEGDDYGDDGGYVTVAAGAVEIDLAPVNDAPVITAPAAVAVDEDGSLPLGGGQISVADADLAESDVLGDPAEMTVTLSVGHGLLTYAGLEEPASELVIVGTVAQVNAALNTLVYTPTPNYYGPDSLVIAANDGGQTGSGAGVAGKIVAITVNAEPDIPELTVPGPQTVAEDTTLTFSSNAIKVIDTDSPVTVTLAVSHGLLTLASTAGLNFTSGDGTLDATMTFWGMADNITAAVNLALNGLKYRPVVNYNGPDTLSITVVNGATVQGQVDITVTAVNDDPVNVGTLPSLVTVLEDGSANLNLSSMQLVDFDSADQPVSVRLSTVNGGLLFATSADNVVVNGSGTDTLMLSGSVAKLNAYLDTVTRVQYAGLPDQNGTDGIWVEISDNGYTGAGGGSWITEGLIAVEITPVNDPPTFGLLENPVEVEETDTAGLVERVGFITNFDGGAPDESGDEILSVSVTLKSTDNADLFLVAPAIDASGKLTFTTAANQFGIATFTVTVTDNGGGADNSSSQDFTIQVTPVPDAPTASDFDFEPILEDGSLTFTAVDVLTLSGAVDADGDPLSVKSVTITGGGAYTLTGVGTGNNPWVFTPEADWNGTVTFTCEITDGTDVVTVDGTLEVDPVNDDPVLSLPTEAIDLVEAQWIKLSDLGISVSDADDDVLTLTVSVPAGEFRTTAIDEDYLSAQLPLPGNGTVTFIGSADDILNDLALIEYSLADADPGSDPFVTVEMDVTLTDGAKEEVSEGVWEEKLQEGTVELLVTDAAPTIELAGAATHNESSTVPYVLTLGPVSDPGGDDLVRMAIYWGDGSVEVFDADSTQVLALNSGGTVAVEHLYGDNSKMVENMIRVSLFSQGKNDEVNVDLPKEYEDAGQLSIKVLNVSPTAAAIIHSGPYQEGTPSGTLTISGVWDPSAVDLALLDVLVDFGVGDLVSVPMPNPLPAGPVDLNVTIPAAFLADNPGGVVRVLLKDDGEGTEYVVNIPVQNKAPILGTLADDTTTAGRTFTKTVQFADPGADSWTATVDFGDGSAPVVYANVGKTFVIDHVYAEATEEETPYTVTVTVTDDDGGSDSETFDVTVIEAATIANRGVFYNGRFGNQLDSSKQALLGGSGEMSGFANYTNYYKGLTGLAIDVNGDHGTITLDDLDFAVGDGSSPSGFVELDPNAVTGFIVLSGQGAGGSDRILITFADYSVMNTWLKVTVKGNDNTNLAQDDVFYFGNAVADVNVGNPTGTVRVSSIDTAALRTNQSPAANSVDVKGVYDVNKDGRVNSIDTAIARVNYRSTVLKHFKG